MSWGSNRIRGNPQSVQKLLDENAQLIQAIVDYQNKGKAAECAQYQQLLHKNLMYLASLADSTQNIPAMPPLPPATSTMGEPSSTIPGNQQDRKGVAGTPMDQGSTGIPNMPVQVISSTGSQIASGIHTTPVAMNTGSGDGTNNTSYGGNVSMNSQALGTSTPPATGYPGNVSQMMAPNIVAATSQSVVPAKQQNFMANMHTTRMQQQGQQFMMQQGVSYNRPPVPMQGHQQQQINQPYMGNQAIAGQTTPAGMVPYQQTTPSYHQYNPMQHMNANYSNPYVPQ